MFHTINRLQIDATDLVASHYSYVKDGGSLHSQTDTRKGPMQHIALRNIAENLSGTVTKARAIMADAGFKDLAADLQVEVTEIAEECEKAVAEINAHSHPDAVWANANHGQKHDLTQRLPASNDVVAKVRARAKGDLRGAT